MMSAMAKLAAFTESGGSTGGWRLSVETVPDIECFAATKALRAERAEIERVSGFILQRMESVVSSERMITIIPSLCALPPIQRPLRSKVIAKKQRRKRAPKRDRDGSSKRERDGARMEKVASF